MSRTRNYLIKLPSGENLNASGRFSDEDSSDQRHDQLTKLISSTVRRSVSMPTPVTVEVYEALGGSLVFVNRYDVPTCGTAFRHGGDAKDPRDLRAEAGNNPGQRPPVYLHLFHDRKSLEDNLEGWGEDGPLLGPFKYVHTTYGVDIKTEALSGDGRSEYVDLQVVGDCVFYDGMYYGDWSVSSAASPDAKAFRADEVKASPPKREKPVFSSPLAEFEAANPLENLHEFVEGRVACAELVSMIRNPYNRDSQPLRRAAWSLGWRWANNGGLRGSGVKKDEAVKSYATKKAFPAAEDAYRKGQAAFDESRPTLTPLMSPFTDGSKAEKDWWQGFNDAKEANALKVSGEGGLTNAYIAGCDAFAADHDGPGPFLVGSPAAVEWRRGWAAARDAGGGPLEGLLKMARQPEEIFSSLKEKTTKVSKLVDCFLLGVELKPEIGPAWLAAALRLAAVRIESGGVVPSEISAAGEVVGHYGILSAPSPVEPPAGLKAGLRPYASNLAVQVRDIKPA